MGIVRHLYDLYKINEAGHFSDEFSSLVSRIVQVDREQYKNHNEDYYNDPASEINRAVDELSQSSQWQDDWHQFVDTMVFSEQKPSFDAVMNNLQAKTKLALAALD